MSNRSSGAASTAAVLLEKVVEGLPPGFEVMRAEALAEGYRFLERLAADWDSGALRFTKAGEALLAAYSGRVLVGMGGLTVDPVMRDALRMRRFYVRHAFRRHHIGRMLATALLDRAARTKRPVTVNGAAGSDRFWESLGFVPDKRDGHTHLLAARVSTDAAAVRRLSGA